MNKNRLRAAGLLAAGAATGGVLAATLTASAADGGSSSSDSDSSSYAAPPFAGGGRGPGGPGDAGMRGPTPVRPDEKTPSDSIVATITKKAEARVSGGTVFRVETDAGDAAYEAHMTKADGTCVTVKFNKDLEITAVEKGMGKGDPRPTGPPPGAPNGAPSGSGTTSGTAA